MAAWLVKFHVEDLEMPQMGYESTVVVSALEFSQVEPAVRAQKMPSDERVDWIESVVRIADDVLDVNGHDVQVTKGAA